MRLLLQLAEALCVFLVIFYLYCRSPAFRPLRAEWPRPRGKIRLYLVFTGIAILGNYLGIPVVHGEAIVNTRAVGATLAGLLGGPVLGFLVGASAGVHRVTALAGAAALPGAIATTFEGVLGGVVHVALRRRPERLMTPTVAFATTFVGEIVHMAIVWFLSGGGHGPEVVRVIALPMVLANPVGAALFMTVLLERQREHDRVAALSSGRALKIAERTLGLMSRGFGADVARDLAAIVKEETGVGAVGVTDRGRVLAWAGIGADHHVPGTPVVSPFTLQAISERTVTFADGVQQTYNCRLSKACALNSVVVVPLQVGEQVVGTVQLFEPRDRRMLGMNRTLGVGLGALLSSQLVSTRYEEQKNLLLRAELKLVHAQVNPHFLFNALTTIMAITRTDPGRARDLLGHLATFFRKNLKRSGELSTLAEELEHVGSYLEIEKARFQERLLVETEVDESLLGLRLPTFTLQPLIENAIKHGVSKVDRGTARIRAYRRDGRAVLEIEDDAGTYAENPDGGGLGMKIVDQRIKHLLGADYGVSVTCVPDELTRVTVVLPAKGVAA
jgi:two-component system LytT family sensor kinase